MDRFSTARLTAERLDQSHLDDLVRLHLDPDVSKFIGGVRTRESTATYLDTGLRHWRDHGFGLWALRSADGVFIGRAGLRYLDLDGARELEILYTLARPHWGRGLATEIAQSLVLYWHEHLIDPTLIGVIDKGHHASNAVLLKAGFAHERDSLMQGVPIGVFRQGRCGA